MCFRARGPPALRHPLLPGQVRGGGAGVGVCVRGSWRCRCRPGALSGRLLACAHCAALPVRPRGRPVPVRRRGAQPCACCRRTKRPVWGTRGRGGGLGVRIKGALEQPCRCLLFNERCASPAAFREVAAVRCSGVGMGMGVGRLLNRCVRNSGKPGNK